MAVGLLLAMHNKSYRIHIHLTSEMQIQGIHLRQKLKTYLLSLSLPALNAAKFSSCWILFYAKPSESLCISSAIDIYLGLYGVGTHLERAERWQEELNGKSTGVICTGRASMEETESLPHAPNA